MQKDDHIAQDDWAAILDGHPVFDLPKKYAPGSGKPLSELSLELSTTTLPTSTQDTSPVNEYLLSGRRQMMALKDADLIVAAGTEIRITSLGDTKLGRSTRKSYKVRLRTSIFNGND
jgi:nucleoporin NUP82